MTDRPPAATGEDAASDSPPELWLGRSLWHRRVENAGVATRDAGALSRRSGPGLPLLVSLWERRAAALAHLAGDAGAPSSALGGAARPPVVAATIAPAPPSEQPPAFADASKPPSARAPTPGRAVVQRREAPTSAPPAVARATPATPVAVSDRVRDARLNQPHVSPSQPIDVGPAPTRLEAPVARRSNRPVARVGFPRAREPEGAGAIPTAPQRATPAIDADPSARTLATSRPATPAAILGLPAPLRAASPSPPLRGPVANAAPFDAYARSMSPLVRPGSPPAPEGAAPARNFRAGALASPAQPPRFEPSPYRQTQTSAPSPSQAGAAAGRTPREPIKLGAPEIGRVADKVYRLLVDRLARERQRRGA